MAGAGEHAHVDPDLGDDALGGTPAHPGDRVQAITGLSERGDDPVDRRVEFGDGPLQLLHVLQGEPHQQGVMAPKRPRRASRSSGSLLRSRPWASSATTLGSRSPASSAHSIARPETPSTSAATEPSRIEASSKVLWMRWHSAV